MLVAAGFTAAATTRRGLLRSTPAVVSARVHASRALSVSVTAQPNTHRTCGPDAISVPQLQLQARSYVTLKTPHSAISSSKAWRCFSSNSWNWSSGGDKTSPSSSSGAQTAGQSTADATATSTDGPADVDAKVQREVLDRCEALHASLMPLNDKVSNFVVLGCSRLAGLRYRNAHPISPF